ncbi:hypothetical protein HDU76_013896 [Blyttiomyces sp. JEL0837]|nr:hypothetical protein HDU76_013896 [Blyttiomyces sp. JEL0837]
MSSQKPGNEEEQVVEEISLSIEETNKLRAALGLRPLDEGSGNKKDQIAAANFANEKKRLQKRQERRALIEKLAKEKESEKLNARLEGKGLGEDDGADDTLSWALRHKKVDKDKKSAMEREREMEEMENSIAEYTAADLKGLRVGHGLDDIKDEILVLADKGILDEDNGDDELVSVAITDKERIAKNLENKKKKPVYNVHDDDEFLNPGQKKSLLSQYDEEIDGPMKIGFTIGEGGGVGGGEDSEEARRAQVAKNLRGDAISLEYEKMREIRDYYTQEEAVSFTKPKKRKKKGKSRVKESDEGGWPTGGLNGDGEDVDMEEVAPVAAFSKSNKSAEIENMNFVDDDELQDALSRARKIAVKKQLKTRPEDIADMVESVKEEVKEEEMDDDDGGLILSATSEFVNNLSTVPVFQAQPEPSALRRAALELDDESDDEDVKVKIKSDEEDDAMEEERGGWRDAVDDSDEDKDTLKDRIKKEEEGGELANGPIEEEPLVSKGMAATLALLSKKGFLEKVDKELIDKEKKQRDRAKWLAEQRVKEKVRELEKEKERARNKAKGGLGGGRGHDEWHHEEDSRYEERRKQRELEERFKAYNPDIDIKYVDEYGHAMNAKEAFRFLSHKFHGKGSGKMKTEKRLRRKEEEVKMMQMLSHDTPLGTAGDPSVSSAPKTKAAHVVLSVGNRGVLPTDISISESSMAVKKPADIKGKKMVASTLMKPRSFAGSGSLAGTASVLGGGATTTSIVETASAVPIGGNREKVAFGLSLGRKRKADDGSAFEESVAKKAKEDE